MDFIGAFIGYPTGFFDQTIYFPLAQVRLVYGHYARQVAKNPELDYDIARLIATPARVGSDNASALGFTDDVTRSRPFLNGKRRSFWINRPTMLRGGRSPPPHRWFMDGKRLLGGERSLRCKRRAGGRKFPGRCQGPAVFRT